LVALKVLNFFFAHTCKYTVFTDYADWRWYSGANTIGLKYTERHCWCYHKKVAGNCEQPYEQVWQQTAFRKSFLIGERLSAVGA
jgi:hypothetical protein